MSIQRIPAITTEYKGITFRSKLEAKYAKAFDKLQMPWMYEELNFKFDDGTCYAPDFYFPESGQFFEVKGLMTPNDEHKIMQLFQAGNTVIVGSATGSLYFYNGSNDRWFNQDDYPLSDVFVNKCRECGKLSFMDFEDGYACPCCGAWDGDHLVSIAHECNDYSGGFFNGVFDD